MEWYTTAILILCGLVFLIFTGLPVAFALLSISIVLLTGFFGWDIMLNLLGTTTYDTATNYTFIAVPLFIFMGSVFTRSGIGGLMCTAIYKWLKFLPGSLAVTSFVGCGIFGAMCGATTATTAAIGSITTPQMLKYGYDRRLATGSVAVGGGLGPIIPPSIFLIIFGMSAQISISDLFIASVTPGLILIGLLSLTAIALCLINPLLAPRQIEEIHIPTKDLVVGVIVPTLIILVVLGSIYLGVCTPVEAAGLGSLAAIGVGYAMKRLDRSGIWTCCMETLKVTCMVLFLLVAAALFSKLIVMERIAQNMAAFVVNSGLPPWGIMFAMMVVVFLGGFFIEGCALITLLVPVFLPIVKALHYDPVLFGIAFTINLCMGAVTPPFAVNLFVMAGICPEVSFSDITKGVMWFVPVEIVLITLVLAFPSISLWPIAH